MLVLGYLHNFSISNNGNNTKFLFNKRGCGTSIFSFLNLRPLKSIISISHVLGKFFIFFFLPSFFSISFSFFIKENGSRSVLHFKIIFKYLG